jgi:hypothetical protein
MAFRKFDLELIRDEYLALFASCSPQQGVNSPAS